MKKIFISIIGLLFLSTIIVSCSPSANDAIKYNDELVSLQNKVYEKESALLDAISKNTPDKLDTLFANLSKQINESTKKVEALSNFDGKSDMKDAVLKIFSTYKNIAGNEYKNMISYSKIPDSLYTPGDDDKVLELSKKIDDKINKSIDDFIRLQKQFAAKYKFELTDNNQKGTLPINGNKKSVSE